MGQVTNKPHTEWFKEIPCEQLNHSPNLNTNVFKNLKLNTFLFQILNIFMHRPIHVGHTRPRPYLGLKMAKGGPPPPPGEPFATTLDKNLCIITG
jgi:hypothetical protein